MVSCIGGIAGLIVDPVYSMDWWRPLTVTSTIPGIESFIFGFSVSGVASVIYMEIFKKKVNIQRASKKQELRRNLNYFFIILLALIIFLFSFFVLNLNSFQASFPSLLIPTFIIYFKRRDLILDSVLSGIFLLLTSFIFYIIPEILFPGWIKSAWNFGIISGITILKVPVEDLVWFFLVGLLVGPLYEYSKQGKLIKIKKR